MIIDRSDNKLELSGNPKSLWSEERSNCCEAEDAALLRAWVRQGDNFLSAHLPCPPAQDVFESRMVVRFSLWPLVSRVIAGTLSAYVKYLLKK